MSVGSYILQVNYLCRMSLLSLRETGGEPQMNAAMFQKSGHGEKWLELRS